MAGITVGVTGSSGFIGSHFISQFQTPIIPFTGNLLDIPTVIKYFKTNHITHLVHLVGAFDLSFDNLMQKNVNTTQYLLEIGKDYGLQKIVYTSTGAVYGEPQHNRSKETDVCSPNTLYGVSKLYAEQIITYYQRNYGIGYVILRLPNVYGEGNTKGVIFNFLKAVKLKKEIVIAGSGEQRRNFLYVLDACDAITKALSYEGSDTFNIAPEKHYSLLEICKLLTQKYDFTIQHKQADNPLKNLILDSEKSKSMLKFTSKNDLQAFLL